jgi:hypothetical protein
MRAISVLRVTPLASYLSAVPVFRFPCFLHWLNLCSCTVFGMLPSAGTKKRMSMNQFRATIDTANEE